MGALIFVLLTLWAVAARVFLLQQMPEPSTLKRAGPPRRGTIIEADPVGPADPDDIAEPTGPAAA